MKKTIGFFTVLLVLWIAGCSWYYVCKVRNDCTAQISETGAVAPDMNLIPDTLTGSQTVARTAPPPAYTILFGTGSETCRLTEKDLAHLELVKTFLNADSAGRVYVTGHADNTGGEALNMKISLLRAESVKQHLLQAGIPADKIIVAGKGELEPVSDNDTDEGRAKNRRVEILTN
jgi:outer membrane protein OmpA-like peptidoglycan-associated protein